MKTKTIGIVFRKYDRDYAQCMKRQTFNFIREVDKLSSITEIVRYNVQSDIGSVKQFHSHILFSEPCMSTIRKVSERVLKADKWDNDYIYFGNVEVLRSRFGEVRIHGIYDEAGFINYINDHKKNRTGKYSYYYYPKHQFNKIMALPF
ncbi:hypothetical protein N9Y86_04665 [Flavobacteriaceae bacterium]|nr:hypothetical protein [Flavobacteriaceae bacterium]